MPLYEFHQGLLASLRGNAEFLMMSHKAWHVRSAPFLHSPIVCPHLPSSPLLTGFSLTVLFATPQTI